MGEGREGTGLIQLAGLIQLLTLLRAIRKYNGKRKGLQFSHKHKPFTILYGLING
jgi:hypothetical protein